MTLLIGISQLFLYVLEGVLKRRHFKSGQGKDKIGSGYTSDFSSLFLGDYSHLIPLDGRRQAHLGYKFRGTFPYGRKSGLWHIYMQNYGHNSPPWLNLS